MHKNHSLNLRLLALLIVFSMHKIPHKILNANVSSFICSLTGITNEFKKKHPAQQFFDWTKLDSVFLTGRWLTFIQLCSYRCETQQSPINIWYHHTPDHSKWIHKSNRRTNEWNESLWNYELLRFLMDHVQWIMVL